DGDGTAIERGLARDGIEQRGLARAVRADDRHELPGWNLERHAAQRAGFDGRAGVESNVQVVRLKHCRLRACEPALVWKWALFLPAVAHALAQQRHDQESSDQDSGDKV